MNLRNLWKKLTRTGTSTNTYKIVSPHKFPSALSEFKFEAPTQSSATEYFKNDLISYHDDNLARAFVFLTPKYDDVLGFFTIRLDRLHIQQTKVGLFREAKLPVEPLPLIVLDRLARNALTTQAGFGGQMLAVAASFAKRERLAPFLALHPENGNPQLTAYYSSMGFKRIRPSTWMVLDIRSRA